MEKESIILYLICFNLRSVADPDDYCPDPDQIKNAWVRVYCPGPDPDLNILFVSFLQENLLE
jgi:hypothetical protein